MVFCVRQVLKLGVIIVARFCHQLVLKNRVCMFTGQFANMISYSVCVQVAVSPPGENK